MKILFATSEAHPIIKTGGLADVCGSLPNAYQNLNHKVRLVMPAYGDVWDKVTHVSQLVDFTLRSCGRDLHVRIHKATAAGIEVPIWLVDIPELFYRPGNPYLATDGKDWWDNGERFGIFSKVVAEIAMDRVGLEWQPEVVQANDWQTGLVPAWLSLEHNPPKTVFTIHNMAYAGLFPKSLFNGLELPPVWWEPENGVEFYDNLSMLKAGIQMADVVTTVSPTYAQEITYPEYAYGLEGVLIQRAEQGKLVGILNGIDQSVWNPKIDPMLARNYTAEKGRVAAKKQNKKDMLSFWDCSLDEDSLCDPVIGFVGRLVPQKGIDLILELLPELIKETAARFVIVGTGEAHSEYALTELSHQYPERVMVYIGYSESMAHKVEAGADLFIMPSRFEPCGLNQLYSLAYGTLPIVHSTGGLADTVVNATPKNLAAGTATGFVFYDPSRYALKSSILDALTLYTKKRTWQKLQKTAMQQNFGWNQSAKQYLALFKNLE